MKYIFIIITIILFAGCSLRDIKIDEKKITSKDIYDLQNIPQDVSYFAKNIDNNISFYEIQKKYEQRYFSMWNIEKPKEGLISVKWPFFSYRPGKSYGENLQPLEQSFFDTMLSNANFDTYA
ncbi:MAG: NlpC/P60 family N-terminal domain-containing protein, partial [Campylobacterota bacterium]